MTLALEYCLLDLKLPIQPGCLFGLHLPPLANSSFTTFDKNGISERMYIARGDEYGLRHTLVQHQLVDKGVPDEVEGKAVGHSTK